MVFETVCGSVWRSAQGGVLVRRWKFLVRRIAVSGSVQLVVETLNAKPVSGLPIPTLQLRKPG